MVYRVKDLSVHSFYRVAHARVNKSSFQRRAQKLLFFSLLSPFLANHECNLLPFTSIHLLELQNLTIVVFERKSDCFQFCLQSVFTQPLPVMHQFVNKRHFYRHKMYLISQILLSTFLICKVIQSHYLDCCQPGSKYIDLEHVRFSNIPNASISTLFIGSMRCSLSKANGPVRRHKLVLLYLCSILLTQSYAPEPNPGPCPVKFPCAVCHKAVKWMTPGVCCNSCEVWYHQERMGMPDGVYNGLKYVSWECFQCGIPNISTSIFDTTIFELSNSFSQLSSNEHLSPESEKKL